MDIIIMAVLTALALLAYRGAKRVWVIGLWTLGLVLMLILFKIHATSHLHLNF